MVQVYHAEAGQGAPSECLAIALRWLLRGQGTGRIEARLESAIASIAVLLHVGESFLAGQVHAVTLPGSGLESAIASVENLSQRSI
jgi:hypothetical protein